MPNLTIEEIKQSLSIVDLATKYGAHPKSRTGKVISCKYNILRPTEKNKANTPDKLEISKYCSKCKKVQLFKEKK